MPFLSVQARADSLAATSETVFARALVDVVPQIEGELGFQTGDLITVTEVVDDDWFYGQCHNRVGLVSTICVEFLNDFGNSEPSSGSSVLESSAGNDFHTGHGRENRESHQGSFTKESQGLEDMERSTPSESNHYDQNLPQHSVSYTSENTRSHDAEITPYAKTLYPFQAQLPTELSFGDGEIVTLIQHVDEDWIEGELDGKIGLFPATFVEIIVDCPYAYNTSSAPQPQNLENFTRVENNKSIETNKTKAVKESLDLETVENRSVKTEPAVSEDKHAEMSPDLQPSSQVLPSHEGGGNGNCDDQTLTTACASSLALVLHSFNGEVQGDLAVKEGDTIEVLRIIDSDWLEARDDQGMMGLVPKNHVEVISGAPRNISRETAKAEESGCHVVHVDDSVSAQHAETPSVKRAAGEAMPSGVAYSNVQSSTDSSGQGISTGSVFHASPSDSKPVNRETSSNQSVPHSSNHHSQRSVQPALAKPTPLPKPKLAPKPVIKPKPTLSPKPFMPTLGSSRQLVVGHTVSPSKKRASSNLDSGDGDEPDTKDTKVFAGINAGLSLDNLVEAELEKARSEGERSRGGSVIEEEKQSRSGSFSSTVSEEHQATSMPVDPQQSSANYEFVIDNLGKIEGLSSSRNTRSEADLGRSVSADEPLKLSLSQSNMTDSVVTMGTRQNGSTRPLSSSELHTLLPPTAQLNRSTSDSRFAAANEGSEAPPTSKANHRHSMPPARPIPPPPKADSKLASFVNRAFEHESEGKLVSLDAVEASHPPPPNRTLPRPPLPVLTPANHSVSTDQDLLGSVERRVRRPPPRPLGPRVASVPSKTPLQPVRVDSDKPIPNRPAPAAPSNRRSAPVAPGSLSPSVAPPTTLPPRPVSMAWSTPPKRPPPRLQKSPNDLMRFSPEPVVGEHVCLMKLTFTLYFHP